jgi:molybdopterin-dependent oxidoreductase alpha subunit
MTQRDSTSPPPPHPPVHEPVHPAAGWGALKSSLYHVVKNKGVARNMLSLLQVNQPKGFDCPGCAWPDPKDGHASAFEFCENGVKAVTFETTAKRVTRAFFAQHPVKHLAQQSDFWLEDQGRLTEPMRYNAATDRYEPVSWDDAFAMIGRALRGLDHPDRAVFYTSGRTSNEAAFLYQLLARRVGTNNMPDCSNMCHESSGAALGQQIGIGKGTTTLDDFEQADAVFIIGQNPGSNHPRMLSTLQQAALRGCKIVSFNPLRERGLLSFLHPQHAMPMLTGKGTNLSTHYYQVLIGGDLAAIKGIMKLVLEAEDAKPGSVLDHAFIREHTTGFEAMAADLRATNWDDITRQSGLTRQQIREAADLYLASGRVIICWAMGLTQHKHAVPTIQAIVNLLLMRGMIGKPGAGACPVRGHSNVQGDRTMGITERPKQDFLDSLERVFAFKPPTHHGYDVVDTINAMLEGKARVFIAMGGNFASATPDSETTFRAIERCELTVQVSTKLNRSHVIHGKDALILPCLGRTEIDMQASGPQRVTVEDSMSQVHASQGKNPPASPHLKSEVAIVAGIARATFPGDAIPWDELAADYSRIRDKIEATMPALFKDYNQRINTPGGFYLGNSAREHRWLNSGGKARFMVAPIPDLTLPPGQLRMMTIRSHDQFNTTVYDLNDRYRGVFGTRMVIFMNEQDAADRGLRDGDLVDLTSHSPEDGKERHAKGFKVVVYEIPPGCCATYFPETNVLVSKDSYATMSRTPVSKFVPITVCKA